MLGTTNRRVFLSAGVRRARVQPAVHPRMLLFGAKSITTNAPIPRKTKVWDSVDEAVSDIKEGDVLLSGGECSVPTAVRTG